MIRILLFLLILIAGAIETKASEPIAIPYGGASTVVKQPHVTAELIPEKTLIMAGQPFDVILHLHADPDWHTYWINPGDAGLATKIDWTLPPGFTAGPIQWPTPEKHSMGPLITYGYEGDVYLLTTITPSDPKGKDVTQVQIKAHAEWLVCKEECIPGKGDFEVNLNLASKGAMLDYKYIDNTKLFAEARARLPVPNTRWDVKGIYLTLDEGAGPSENLYVQFKTKSGFDSGSLDNPYFFPEQSNVLDANEKRIVEPDFDQGLSKFELTLLLQQNGEKPAQISGVLVSNRPLIGAARAIYISAFPTDSKDIPEVSTVPGNVSNQKNQMIASDSVKESHVITPYANNEALNAKGTRPWLIAVLGAAFLGGLILNLMPCVLPVLSLKVFSLMRHAGENPRAAWIQGAAFTVGVVVSFWVLAGLLLALRAAGNQLGWGFQMQSPGFVLALIFIFFLLALNLFGVFELGTSLVGLDAKATSHVGGMASSFLNGALATVAATPCTAPFMGSSLGFAAQQPTSIALLIFTFLALGMATPYLLLTIFPGALRFVPKPGAWMEAFKQFMGFLLMGTVAFLVYVWGALVSQGKIPELLAGLIVASVAAWVYGRWAGPMRTPVTRFAGGALALALMIVSIAWSATLKAAPLEQTYSESAVQQALSAGRPVFVDFTAAWCLSCKVNEQVALENEAVKKAFAQKNVLLLKADWTHQDPEITKALARFNRVGVPLYLLYSPKDKEKPQVLPEVLTPGIVLDALQRL